MSGETNLRLWQLIFCPTLGQTHTTWTALSGPTVNYLFEPNNPKYAPSSQMVIEVVAKLGPSFDNAVPDVHRMSIGAD